MSVKKIALLISGYLRSFEFNISNLKKNLLFDKYSYDIYIHITEDEEKQDSKYTNKPLNLEKIKSELDPKFIIISKNLIFKENDINQNNILNQNYKFWLLNKISKIENINYDIIFKIRPDVNLNTPIIFENYDLTKINIPTDDKISQSKLFDISDDHICDIMAFGNPTVMEKYFEFYDYLSDSHLKKNFTKPNETLLYEYFSEKNLLNFIQKVDINYFVILSLCNVISITGDSGSGKSTLANIINEILNDKSSFILECDRYHKWERNDENWKSFTHLNPNANFICKMEKDVFDIKIGNSENVYHVDYDHHTGKFTQNQKILKDEVDNIIVCGLHSLYLNNDISELKIFIETDDDLRIPWKIERDFQSRGYSDIQKIKNQIEQRKDDYQKFILPQKENADYIIYLSSSSQNNFPHLKINNKIIWKDFGVIENLDEYKKIIKKEILNL